MKEPIRTTATRASAYMTAFAKTAGRKFDHRGRPILTAAEWRVVIQAGVLDQEDHLRRHLAIQEELARLEALDATVT